MSWPCPARLIVCATAVAALAWAVTPAGAKTLPGPADSPAQAAKKKKKKKPRPCANQTKRYVLCKPKVGTWKGTVTQQTPSGPVSAALEFTVERDGDKNNGSEIARIGYSLPWWGEGPAGLTSWVYVSSGTYAPKSLCPSCTPVLYEPGLCCGGDHWDKQSGTFYIDGQVNDAFGKVQSDFIEGDFASRTKAKGAAGAEHRSFGTLLKVGWTASWSTKSLPPPPPCIDCL